MRRAIVKSPIRRQSGMSLFPALMFLLVLAVIGIGTLSSTLMQEKMVSSTKDTNIAFQAAEAGLRDAEVDVNNPANINSGTIFTGACASGLCTPPSQWTPPTSADISTAIDWSNAALTRPYGLHTGAPALPDVAAQPLYVIEKLNVPSTGCSTGSSCGTGSGGPPPPPSGITYYRLTVLATGIRPETRVILQSTFFVSN